MLRKKQMCGVLALVTTVMMVMSLNACGILSPKSTKSFCLLSGPNTRTTVAEVVPSAQERTWWNGAHFTSETAPAAKEIEFAGIHYSGSYQRSCYENYNSYATDYYDGENGIEFGINADTGKLVFLDLKPLRTYQTESGLDDLTDPESHLSNLAESYAALFIDTSEYKKLAPAVKPYSSQISLYTYTYARHVNGVQTSDYISIGLTSKGSLATITVGDLGAFDKDTSSAVSKSFRSTDAAELLSKGIDEDVFKDITIKEQIFAMNPSGEPVLCVRAAGTGKLGSLSEETGQSEYGSLSFEFVIK